MKTFINTLIFLIVILVLGIILAPFIKSIEGFESNYFASLRRTEGIYPVSVDQAILDDYPLIGKNETSNDDYSEIWWKNPVLPLSSFKQITNNIRYPKNPDNGTCTPADFCGALYKDIKNKLVEFNPN